MDNIAALNLRDRPEALLENAELPAADQFNIPFVFAKRHGVLVTELQAQQATILHRPDLDYRSVVELRRYLQRPLQLQEIPSAEFNQRLSQHYEAQNQASAHMMAGLEADLDLFQVAKALSSEPEDLLETADDAPIIRLINALLAEAVKENASDIHIEPFENRLLVRFRVDGVLREILQPKRALAPLLVSRIKVMAQLDIAEKRLPQDGRISLKIATRAVDVRVSTLPCGQGERVVLRLLDKQAGRLDLKKLGMNSSDRQRLQTEINKPHGIILVTGPTGSGKTTSLYAMLSELNGQQRNIMTVEDPIEYYIDGINQTPVNNKVDMTFAKGLRAILRQDPDVVMVGEIRDFETAQIAVQASLTGHLVLSTLHTNTAIGAVTRLRDMGIEPFLLSSSLLAVMSQRLVRVLCPECKEAYPADSASMAQLGVIDTPPPLFRPVGCSHCQQTGYKGRSGIYELVQLDDNLRKMIHDQASQQQMADYAQQHGQTLQWHGQQKVLAGETALEELLRVSQLN